MLRAELIPVFLSVLLVLLLFLPELREGNDMLRLFLVEQTINLLLDLLLDLPLVDLRQVQQQLLMLQKRLTFLSIGALKSKRFLQLSLVKLVDVIEYHQTKRERV